MGQESNNDCTSIDAITNKPTNSARADKHEDVRTGIVAVDGTSIDEHKDAEPRWTISAHDDAISRQVGFTKNAEDEQDDIQSEAKAKPKDQSEIDTANEDEDMDDNAGDGNTVDEDEDELMEDQSANDNIDGQQFHRNVRSEDEDDSNRDTNRRNHRGIIEKPKRWRDYRSWPAIPSIPLNRRAFLRRSVRQIGKVHLEHGVTWRDQPEGNINDFKQAVKSKLGCFLRNYEDHWPAEAVTRARLVTDKRVGDTWCIGQEIGDHNEY
ncbi:hypothetical protein EIP86_008273 [Pleurotus ostreatoroseus]|nr:hypothetical protein EIP86_008273 [Pleurotus ostreatoroseus]